MGVELHALLRSSRGLPLPNPSRDTGLIEADQRAQFDDRDIALVDPLINRPGLHLKPGREIVHREKSVHRDRWDLSMPSALGGDFLHDLPGKEPVEGEILEVLGRLPPHELLSAAG